MTVEIIKIWLTRLKIPESLAEATAVLLSLSLLGLLVWLANYVTKRLIKSVINPLIKNSTSITWDDKLIEHGIIIRCSHIVLAAVVHFLTPLIFAGYTQIIAASKIVVNAYLIIIVLLIV